MTSSTPAGAPIYIGCAGWSVPNDLAGQFATAGNHLARYSSRFNTVEINSSFCRPHRISTYARWAATVPERFRFSVKLPRVITHESLLRRVRAPLEAFLEQVDGLAEKLGCLLVQLPPSARFDAEVTGEFLGMLRTLHGGAVVVEPRHPSWFTAEAEALLVEHAVGRVAADPPIGSDLAALPGGNLSAVYFRLHGSPKIYYSTYSDLYLASLASRLASIEAGCCVFCVFDNTASGAATKNALALTETVTSSK
jgi:uncharacterized protein YecE (DUF72 family)